MKHYTYFPGCSSSDGGAKAYGSSSQAVAKALDVDLAELEDWNCCGSTPYTGVDELTSLCIAARNLALAEEKGLDLVTPCSACYVILSRANSSLKEYPEIRGKADDALAAGGLEYHETVRVRHLLDVFANDIGYDEIAYRVKRELGGLKVAPYYGCQVLRPGPGFDHPESPQSLDRLVKSLGATATPFPRTLPWVWFKSFSKALRATGPSASLPSAPCVKRISTSIRSGLIKSSKRTITFPYCSLPSLWVWPLELIVGYWVWRRV